MILFKYGVLFNNMYMYTNIYHFLIFKVFIYHTTGKHGNLRNIMHSAGQNILQSHYLRISGGRVHTAIHHTGKLSSNHCVWQIKYHAQ